MAKQVDDLINAHQGITQLEEENKSLQEEIKALRSKYEAALVNHEKQSLLEKRYEESQVRFRTIFEQSQLGSKIIGPALQIIQVNHALEMMLGYSEKKLQGTRIIEYAHPDYKKQWQQLQENLWTKQIPSFQLDTCLIKKDGSLLWCRVSTILFKDNNATLGYTILEDISERKALEAKLEKQALTVNTDLENFIYTASHDLKSPIVNIEGLVTTLTKKLTSNSLLDDEQNMLLSMIAVSIDRLKSTIADLTEIAKLQKEDVEEELISINTLVEEVYEDLGILTAHLPVKLHKHIEVDKIKFARKSMRSILHNLLSNAIKYHSPNRPSKVVIETKLQQSYIVISVADNGMGIAEDQIHKLFTLFKRFHTHVEGTGIGLYMIKKLIDNTGGKIEVESKVDTGTIFRVYLPTINH